MKHLFIRENNGKTRSKYKKDKKDKNKFIEPRVNTARAEKSPINFMLKLLNRNNA